MNGCNVRLTDTLFILLDFVAVEIYSLKGVSEGRSTGS